MDKNSFQELFLTSLKGPMTDFLGLESEAITSYYMDLIPVQDSFRHRAKYLGLRVGSLLIDEKGELDVEALTRLKNFFDRNSFVLGPGREGDALIFAHIKNCLSQLLEKREIWIAIRKFSPPLCHRKAEEVVRETLWPEEIRTVQTVHIRKAVLAAWLTLLRQTTGSCFATAPAILVQKNEALRFFQDLYDILSIGQLKRVFGGKEYSVPMSINSGSGDLQRTVFGPFFGLVVALEAVGKKITKEDEKTIRDLAPQTVENILRAILLEDGGLTEEELKDEENLARIQMTPLLAKQGVYYQRPSPRALKVSEWKKRVAKATTHFRAITECALLRSWEYTLASFSDVKTEFTRWNLYIGLGIHPEQKFGIGAFLYEQVNEHLQKCQREIEKLTKEYELEIGALQALEVMIEGAVNEMRRNQLKSDWMIHTSTANSIAEMRSRLIPKAESLVGLFSWLIERYDEKLQEYFQELFDPSLARNELHLHDDSPAGFRLVYKHGRSDASQWTAVYTKEKYIEFLRDFFSRVENELDPPPHVGKELISDITTALIQFIQEDSFIDWAFARSKEKGRLSPWDYISGGTLQTLLMAYCNRDRPFSEATIIPHSEEELLQFLISKGKNGPLLMHSPTHAFVFYPELLAAKRIKPLFNQPWSGEMQEHIAHKLSKKLPQEEGPLFIHLLRQKTSAESNTLFRSNLIEALGPRIKNKESLVDSVLYENSYLSNSNQTEKRLQQILTALGENPPTRKLEGVLFGSYDLFELTKFSLLQSGKQALSDTDWDLKITEAMRKFGYLPDALLFADTNWSGWYFGFVQNPTTLQLELWRLNRTATQGFPMNDWKEWLSPENRSAWCVLTNSVEYSG